MPAQVLAGNVKTSTVTKRSCSILQCTGSELVFGIPLVQHCTKESQPDIFQHIAL